MYHIDRAHMILDEMVMNGQIVEMNRTNILSSIAMLERAAKS